MSDTRLSSNVNCVYEVVVNGLSVDAVKKAMQEGINAAAAIAGVLRISAGNYGGRLGPYKAFLKDLMKPV